MGTWGYKAMEPDMTCRGFQYEVGETYEVLGSPRLCEWGFHFCELAADVWHYYERPSSIVCEVEALGEVVTDGTKSVTNRIRIVRRLTPIDEGRLKYGESYGDGDGYGYGYGNGQGDGCCYGYGNAAGDSGYGCYYDGGGDGYCYGYGNGYGYGYSNGYGMNMGYYTILED